MSSTAFSPTPSFPPVSPARVRVPGGRVLAVFFGILLPLAALVTELLTGICRELNDPLPTLGHAVAVGLVPVAHLVALLAVGRGARRPSLRVAAWLNSAALVIGLAYAVLFAPITPFAFMAILAIGLGLLPLAPLTSVLTALCLRGALRRRAAAEGVALPSFWPGLIAGLLFLVALEAPVALGDHGVRRLAAATVAQDVDVQAAALRLLRGLSFVGGDGHLLRGAHEHFSTERRPEFMHRRFVAAAAANDYRLAYYRVTGRAHHEDEPRERTAVNPLGRSRRDGRRDWRGDERLGAQEIGRRLPALDLVESGIEARVEAVPALAYLEWTLVFRNDHVRDQREARALIQLPPGASVSRLTLWVNDEPREAAWSSPGHVIAAYRTVAVVQNRDPVLVTAQGPDRVFMQCFPIPPQGGLMKVRLGVTTPLALTARGAAHLPLPRIIARNFTTPATLEHEVDLVADAPWVSAPAGFVAGADGPRTTMRGRLPVDAAVVATFSLVRSEASASAWTPALRDPAHVVTQALRHRPAASGVVALVISGSAELEPAAEALADLLADAPATPFTTLHLAGDAPETSAPRLTASAQARWLRARDFAGGQDDAVALKIALDDLVARGGGTLVWLHGGQPVAWRDDAALGRAFAAAAAGTGGVRILAVPAVAAPNVLLDKLSVAVVPLTVFPRLAELPADLARLVQELRDGALVAERERVPADVFAASGAARDGARASDHLSRLWARDEVGRLLTTGRAEDRDAARTLALATQIVTPVSGAAVLENQGQYDAAGLSPSDEKNSPVIPEPATTAVLFAATVLAFTVLVRRQRRIRAARIHPEFMRAS